MEVQQLGVVIETAAGVTFSDSADILIGTVTVLAADIATATNSKSATIIDSTNIDTATSNSATTSIIIEAISGIIFLGSADITIGTTTLVHGTIYTAKNTGATTSIVVETASGVTFSNSADILVGTGPGVAVLAANIDSAIPSLRAHISATSTSDKSCDECSIGTWAAHITDDCVAIISDPACGMTVTGGTTSRAIVAATPITDVSCADCFAGFYAKLITDDCIAQTVCGMTITTSGESISRQIGDSTTTSDNTCRPCTGKFWAAGDTDDCTTHTICGNQRIALVNLGNSGCTATNKCGNCHGDCDSDLECAGALKCFQRNGET